MGDKFFVGAERTRKSVDWLLANNVAHVVSLGQTFKRNRACLGFPSGIQIHTALLEDKNHWNPDRPADHPGSRLSAVMNGGGKDGEGLLSLLDRVLPADPAEEMSHGVFMHCHSGRNRYVPCC
jgi:hypothetical protein